MTAGILYETPVLESKFTILVKFKKPNIYLLFTIETSFSVSDSF